MSIGPHCTIQQKPSKVVGVNDYQRCLEDARNKGEMLRVCLRTLSSMGYNSDLSEKLKGKVGPYLADFEG